jgi:hypothetical protein
VLQVISPDIEEVQGGDTSPQLLGWIDVADVLRAFLQREHCMHVLTLLAARLLGCRNSDRP